MTATFRIEFLLALAFGSTLVACGSDLHMASSIEYPPRSRTMELNLWVSELAARLGESRFELNSFTPLPPGWEVVSSFVHLSDAQIRESGLVCGAKHSARLVDGVAGGCRRQKALDEHDEFPLIALVGALNDEERSRSDLLSVDEQPDILIHTGDAMDVGTEGEMLRFLSIANRLAIPWLNVIGNHDVLTFGNFARGPRPDRVNGDWALLTRRGFVPFHSGNDDGSTGATELPAYFKHPPTEATPVSSTRHGFDLNGSLGFYSMAIDSTPPLRLIVLDTTIIDSNRIPVFGGREVPGPGAGWQIDSRQLLWLKEELRQGALKNQLVLVFGHHPLEDDGEALLVDELDIDDARLVDILAADPNVIGYFAGHTHRPEIRIWQANEVARWTRKPAARFVEVIAPSIHETSPQFGYLVLVLRRDDDIALSVRPIWGVPVDRTKVVFARLKNAWCGAAKESGTGSSPNCDHPFRNAPRSIEDPQVVAGWTNPDGMAPPAHVREVNVAVQLMPQDDQERSTAIELRRTELERIVCDPNEGVIVTAPVADLDLAAGFEQMAIGSLADRRNCVVIRLAPISEPQPLTDDVIASGRLTYNVAIPAFRQSVEVRLGIRKRHPVRFRDDRALPSGTTWRWKATVAKRTGVDLIMTSDQLDGSGAHASFDPATQTLSVDLCTDRFGRLAGSCR